jgi:S-methylmethionine-dependent homocysteine/selenocysteine methylase
MHHQRIVPSVGDGCRWTGSATIEDVSSAKEQAVTAPDQVPELSGQVMLADTGIETDLIFHHGVDLPLFAAFVLADDGDGRELLDSWHREHAAAATAHGLGVSLDAPTWRASSDWGEQLGYDAAGLDRVNRDLVARLQAIRSDLDAGGCPVVVGGTLGPRSDGYHPTLLMTSGQAADYHRPQLSSFVEAGADRATAMTLGYAEEAIGIASAAGDLGLPVILGFTVEIDGRLPDGTALSAAIAMVDARTGSSAAGFMVNCAHPDHIAPALNDPGPWLDRLIGLRPNASRRSHAELDEARDLDDGDPVELAAEVAALLAAHPSIALVGGCCGTDVRHARSIAAAVTAR